MRLRLFLSFALITLVTLAILGFVIQSQTQSTLTTFALRGGFFGADRLVNQLEAYYLENGSWEGISEHLSPSELSQNTENENSTGGSQGQGMGGMQGRGNARGSGNMVMGNEGMFGQITLSDADGNVLISDNPDLPAILSADILEKAFPIMVEDQAVGYLIPENNLLDLSEIIQENLSLALNRSLLPTVIISAAVALLLALVLAHFLMRPVRRLTDAATQLGKGDLTQRVQLGGGGELNQLANTFNHMAGSLEKSQKARQAMTADIAHELRNPLSVQRANLEALQDGVYPLTIQNLEPIIQQNQLLNKLVEDLRTLTLADTNSLKLEKTPTDPVPFIEKICDNVRPQFEANEIKLTFDHRDVCPPIPIDPSRINQVIYNLLQNSLRHSPQGGSVKLTLSCDAQFAILTIQDSGDGIPEEALPLIFERFYRADQSRTRDKGGTGLGLTIARHLAEAHHGSLTASNHPDGGAVFTLSLPYGV